jgi:hypothetical protein
MSEEIPGLDEGIAPIVEALRAGGVDTIESCEGGPGHTFREATVRFRGDYAEGFRALSVALGLRLPVLTLERVWRMVGNEPSGPGWQMTFILRKTNQGRSPAFSSSTTSTNHRA